MHIAHIARSNGTPYRTIASVVAGTMLLSAVPVYAQVGQLPATPIPSAVVSQSDLLPAIPTVATPRSDARPLWTIVYHTSSMSTAARFGVQPVAVIGGRSHRQQVAGAVKGGLFGFLLGGYLGGKIEGNCGCDDPGLKGAIVGAPIGAIVGAILGARFL